MKFGLHSDTEIRKSMFPSIGQSPALYTRLEKALLITGAFHVAYSYATGMCETARRAPFQAGLLGPSPMCTGRGERTRFTRGGRGTSHKRPMPVKMLARAKTRLMHLRTGPSFKVGPKVQDMYRIGVLVRAQTGSVRLELGLWPGVRGAAPPATLLLPLSQQRPH